jgi:hypothetical protein
LTVDEAAKIIGVGKRWLQRRDGNLPFVRRGFAVVNVKAQRDRLQVFYASRGQAANETADFGFEVEVHPSADLVHFDFVFVVTLEWRKAHRLSQSRELALVRLTEQGIA